MTDEFRARVRSLAERLQRFGVAFSALLGALVGATYGEGLRSAWQLMFGGNLIILIVGMVAVLLSVFSERVAPGDWVTGMNLNCRIFLAHTTAFGLMVLLVSWLTRLDVPSLASAETALLALRLLPGLYLCSVMAIVLSGPLYLRWVPNPNERR